MERLKYIDTKIFELSYYTKGGFSYIDCTSMTLSDLEWYYAKLVQVKEDENEQHRQAIEQAKSKQNAPRPARRSRRR